MTDAERHARATTLFHEALEVSTGRRTDWLKTACPDTDLRRWGLERAGRGGRIARKKAVGGVARKIAVLLHRLWITGEVYEPLRNTTTPDELAA